MIWTSLPDTFLATSMTLQSYLAIGQLTGRLRKSSLSFLMHINTYFVTALPMCLTYPLTQVFRLDFFHHHFHTFLFPFSTAPASGAHWIQKLIHDTYTTLHAAYVPGSIKNMQSHIRSYLLFCLSIGHPHQQLSIPVLCNYLLFYHIHWLMAPSRITSLRYIISMNCSPFKQICTMTFTYTLLFVVYSVKLETVHKESFLSLLTYFAICIQLLTLHHLLMWHSGQLAWWHFSPSFRNLTYFLPQPLLSTLIAT